MLLYLLFSTLLTPVEVSTRGYQRPIIEEVYPSALIQETNTFSNDVIPITLVGKNFWPKDHFSTRYNQFRVQVLMKRSQGGFIRLPEPIRGWQGEQQTLKTSFSAKEFLKKSEPIQIMVKVDSQGSAPYTLSVLSPPKRVAEITSIAPSTFPAGSGPFQFRLFANNLDAPNHTRLLINGITIPIEYLDIRTGIIEATLPPALWNRTGIYQVQLFTRKGSARLQKIAVVEPSKSLPPSVSIPINVPSKIAPIYPIPQKIDERYEHFVN